MTQAYSDPKRRNDPHALPDIEAFQLTAAEVAASSAYEDEQYEFSKRHEFRHASMNSRTQERMLDAMVEELGITGGWYYWYCLPGCMPDSEPYYDTEAEAIAAAQEAA